MISYMEKYLWYLLRHKYFVFIECCKLHIIWRGIIHDWSKFRPSEFVPYAQHFYGQYPTQKEVIADIVYYSGFTKETVKEHFDYAWLLHQRCNKLPWQGWGML